ncbi:iron-hydroxamate transporter ATP-binding subunit [Terasakiispira papahanaumokuakeensis]|uniref:Iron-hydroxamate transporter ATP-binding subunit n=1 Tax=Terasakiispira papahanaumokuakeensis TaxID=197479 RepID=A0A1E2VBW0_9GAMM|nr:ATP-binding cassette domain-containing protein [Terasakiispira papahanaumokuakeensis]ODC04444.1 iron-hydroxamate transporter ATP-binding subunit [Terasakiispira papahanaumokuakeensis]
MFNVQAATFAVEERCLLQPLDLNLQGGQVHGLIGHNGSGKSTLLKLLARQQPRSSGEITFDGRSLDDWRPREFARQVAYLPQQLPESGALLGKELVAFGRYPWRGLLGRQNAEDRHQIERAMALTHTEAFADRPVGLLSGGERQRLWLAMLLAQQSRFLLLDEPLSALDIAHQVDVLKLIQKLTRELDLGVVIVLHDINMAARYCDNLVALHQGRLLEQGPPATLMTNEVLARIYGLPLQVVPHPQDACPVALVPA